MSLNVIGAGLGRTGTYSLRLAIDQLGLGPTHHMEAVLHNQPSQVPLWTRAARGQAEWSAIYAGYHSAVDWPTAAFFGELAQAYPNAHFILTTRSAESWAASFAETIYSFIAMKDRFPQELHPWIDMASTVIRKSGIPDGLNAAGLMQAFVRHNTAVQSAIPALRLLVYQVSEGWGPLCKFLGKPIPSEPFPRSNNRSEFWDLVPAPNPG